MSSLTPRSPLIPPDLRMRAVIFSSLGVIETGQIHGEMSDQKSSAIVCHPGPCLIYYGMHNITGFRVCLVLMALYLVDTMYIANVVVGFVVIVFIPPPCLFVIIIVYFICH